MPVTGDGDFPLRSAWLGRGRGRGANPRDFVNVAYSDTNRFVWSDYVFESAPAGGAISASVSVAFSPAGAIGGQGALSGASAPAFTTAGILRGSGVLSGATSGSFTTSATGLAFGALSGSSTATFAPSGTAAGAGALVGSLALVFSTQALGVGLAGAMAASASIGFSTAGSLTGLTEEAPTSLHGRRIRGKRVYFPDEIDPVQEPEVIREVIRKVEAPTLPGLEPLAAQLAEAKREAAALLARIARERKAKDRQDKIAALSTELAMVAEAIEETKAQERAWIARLRDEDEFFLLAA